MRPLQFLILSFLISLLWPLHTRAQKHVTTTPFEEGTVVFVDKYKFQAADNDMGLTSSEYDITLVTVNDSVSFTSTTISQKVFKPESVSMSGDRRYPVEKIYIDPKNGKWVSRLRFYIPFAEFERMASEDVPPTIVWYTSSVSFSFTLKEKEWAKQRKTWQYAIDIIHVNQE